MKPIVGIELSAKRIRAVVLSPVLHRPLRRFDIPWQPDLVEDAVSLLRENLGNVSAIGVAVGMDFLLPKEIKLPPVSAFEKRRMVSLEPDRFFPVATPVVVSASLSNDLVLAADAARVERWIAALEQWAPVQNVEGAPSAYARAAGRLKFGDGTYEIEYSGDQHAYVEIRRGLLLSARLVRSSALDGTARKIPDSDAIPAAFAPALGAALGTRSTPDVMLLSDERHSRIAASRRQSLIFAALFTVASLGSLLVSAARSRERYLDRVELAISVLRPRAAAAQSLQGRIDQVGIESSASREAQNHVDPLSVLATLSRRIPRDAVVMTLHGSGEDWQVSGTAKDAAAIIPALDADSSLENVRFLAGTSRFTEGHRTYETFSIGFHVGQKP